MSTATAVQTSVPKTARRRRRMFRGFASRLGLVCAALFVLIGTLGRLVGDPNALVAPGAEPPSASHWFGTDNLGRDVFARTASGAFTSGVISVSCILFALALAIPLGLLAGYWHGRFADGLVMRTLETVQALPMFIFVMFLLSLFDTTTWNLGAIHLGMEFRLIICLGLGFVPFFARVVRAATIVEMSEPYVAGLRALGVPTRTVLFREVSVNVLPQVAVQAFLGLAIAIFAEGGLSFLGLGVPLPKATLGNLIADAGSQILEGDWWYATLPGVVMVIGIVGFNLIGDALNSAIMGSSGRAEA